MTDTHHVIIGNGASANRAADVLRDGDPSARITLISDEFFPFYFRHRLIGFATGDLDEASLVARDPSVYKERRIRPRLGQRVLKTDLATRTLYLAHMEKVRFTSLLLCAGSVPRIPEILHASREHFATLKTLSDARRLRALLPRLATVILAGGDLVGFRLATALAGTGIAVRFIVDESAFWPLELSSSQRSSFCQSLATKGVEVIENSLRQVEPDGSGGYRVTLASGQTIAADLVGGFFGSRPDVDFLFGSGLDIERGILVDEYLKTNIEHVYAAGDCAQVYAPRIRNYWTSFGWANAERLGEVAAGNILGRHDAAAPKQSVLEVEGIQVTTPFWKEFET